MLSGRAAVALLLLAALGLAGAARAQPAPLQGLSLTDHHRRALDVGALKGRSTLLHFVFTTCSATCPLQVRELAQVHDALPADVRERVRFVSVSVDPLQDTPTSLAAFARRLDADRAGWHFVTGPAPQIHLLADRLQALPASRRAEDHRSSLYLFGATGALVQRYAGVPVDRARLVAELKQITRLAQHP